MLIEIKNEEDLQKLEDAIRDAVGAQRMDVSVLRSRPYIELRQNLMRLLDQSEPKSPIDATYFANETTVLRIVTTRPLLVWCGHKDADI